MRLVFITFCPLDRGASHTARVSMGLGLLSTWNDVTIICMGNEPESEATRKRFPKVSFHNIGCVFRGWEIPSLSSVIEKILHLINRIKPDLVLQTLEVWELMRELSLHLSGTKYATMIHGMPFLAAPLNPSGDFKKDVLAYCAEPLEEFKRNYILRHHLEAQEVLSRTTIIANNETSAFYMSTYFKKTSSLTMSKALVTSLDASGVESKRHEIEYDLVYMARMERKKGVEFLPEIVHHTADLLPQPLRVAIMGRTEDRASEDALRKLAEAADRNNSIHLTFLGWADNELKNKVLRRSAVFIYPSCFDNYPTVMNEALFCGLPCITWDVLFSRLSYSQTLAVSKVAPFDTRQFAKSIIDVLSNREKFSNEVQSYVESLPSPSQLALLDQELYNHIVSGVG